MPDTSQKSLIHFFSYCCEKKLPFAFYRLPETGAIKIMAQKNAGSASNAKPGERGFVFAPFVEDEFFKKVFIKADIYGDAENCPHPNPSPTERGFNSFSKEKVVQKVSPLPGRGEMSEGQRGEDSGFLPFTKLQFKAYVKKIRSKIRSGKLGKVVAARTALKNKPADFNPVTFFQQLCKKYPAAFVSLVYTPQYGLWIGASPEVLLQAGNKTFKTYSLAGTKANNKQNAKSTWGEKEKEEQKLVSGFIIKAFQKVTSKAPVVEGPVTVTAGNLLHLRTTFLYKGLPVSQWQDAVKQLHPTPAVAGLPRKKSIHFILKNEPSPRGFYSGYLGPVNVGGTINLFVNLRCMQVLENKLALYVGCGVTKHSKPEQEWIESKIKTETLLNVLVSS